MADADVADATFAVICEELRISMLPCSHQECFAKVDLWESRHVSMPFLAHAVRNHASGIRMALAKTPSPAMNVNIHGDGNTIQQGANVSRAGDNATAINANPSAATHAGIKNKVAGGFQWLNVVVGAIAAILAVWWLMPQAWALGSIRLYVSVAVAVFACTYMWFGAFQFKRRNWEKIAYMTLGSTLVVRSLLPSVVGGIAGAFGASGENINGHLSAYFGTSNDIVLPIAQLIIGAIILVFAFFTKTR